MIKSTNRDEYYVLNSPTLVPKASGFLWNEKMMVHVNCRGYITAQFMQPEPAKYSHGPNIEASTFMQPEQPYYAHHPGRFVYIKDITTNKIYSAPYEPVRAPSESYNFILGKDYISWTIKNDGIITEMKLSLAKDDSLEMWQIKVKNISKTEHQISIYPYFTVGYMSWMNQSGKYIDSLQGIVCSSITPYQKCHEYPKIKNLKDKTFLLAEEKPDAYDANQKEFEGEGGIMYPSAIQRNYLTNSEALYEMPVATLQYLINLKSGEEKKYRFLFGPAKDEKEIEEIRNRYFLNEDVNKKRGYDLELEKYSNYINGGQGCLEIDTPDKKLNDFVNHWLPRQMFYHGKTNRLSTDPQTRNYLQDNMGMSYICPSLARNAFLNALCQQLVNGAMPDGILLNEDAQLKYINQVPHADHNLWLPICLSAYLEETDDYEVLDEKISFADDDTQVTVYHHINRGMEWLISNRNNQGLNYINQGDWCDPMNMVGYKGRGVSGWLTIATAYALKVWADICEKKGDYYKKKKFNELAIEMNNVANKYLWDGEWYARGITDEGVTFGISKDSEGRIYLNPQGWALLSGAADHKKQTKIIKSVSENLESPYGIEMLAPSYTSMREDVGRITQKFPGTAENGSIYNHAEVFYIYSLFQINEGEKGYELLSRMIPGPNIEDIIHRGQLPVFIPNYYRGAYKQFPKVAGRSSQLFNTGTVQWYYRCLIDGLFGIKGCRDGLKIQPQLPDKWEKTSIKRLFRKAVFNILIIRVKDIDIMEISVNNQAIEGSIIRNIEVDTTYQVIVKLPKP